MLHAYVLPRLTSLIPSTHMSLPEWPHLKGLSLADPEFANPGKIDLIIGADIYGQLLEGSIKKGPLNSPTAQYTKLGWIISGPSSTTLYQQDAISHHCSVDYDLHSLLEKFWVQEEIKSPLEETLSPKDEECENHFSRTHSRDHTGRYIVRLPFNTLPEQVGNSRPSATRMLNHLSHKFKSDSSYFEAYSNFLKEYESLGHMNLVHHANSEKDSAFYLPHHGVIRESSSTTKLRVVFNGSCKVSGGISIDEALHAGPKRQRDLFDVLLWLKQFPYIFSSDIEKMYRQILVHPDDRKYQRILWKLDDNLVEYELNTVTYGLTCAPFLALRSILQLVEDEGSKYPQAIDTVLKGRYVDDIFGGADTIAEA